MKRKHLILMAIIFLVLSLGIGLTFSYFVPAFVGTSGEEKLALYKYNLKVNYINTSSVLINSTTSTVTKNMTVENKNNSARNYLLIFDNVVNTIPGGATLTYAFTCSSTISTCANKTSTAAPTKNGELSTVRSIAAGAVHTYEITFTLSGTITTETFSTNINTKLINYMVTPGAWDGTAKFWSSRSTITQITFETEINIPEGTASNKIWDMAVAGDGSIMAYKDASNVIHIQSNGPITCDPDGEGMFGNMSNLTAVNNAYLLDTSQVTTMKNMFRTTPKLTTLDLSGWNTSKVTSMYEMFYSGTGNKLASLDISTWDTSSVTTMQSMFYETVLLKAIYFNSGVFTNVTGYSGMFTSFPSTGTKGNIYVKDTAGYNFIYARLSTAQRNYNNIIIDATCSNCPANNHF